MLAPDRRPACDRANDLPTQLAQEWKAELGCVLGKMNVVEKPIWDVNPLDPLAWYLPNAYCMWWRRA
jgi:hypothetical protein